MPITEERLYRGDRLNKWFAVSSVLMTGSILWMIQIDYDRPWHKYQDAYAIDKAAFAHLDFLDTQREAWQEGLAEAEARLADAVEFAERTTSKQRQELVDDLARSDLEFRQVDAPWGQISQVLEVTRDTYERAVSKYAADHPAVVAADQAVRDQEAQEVELRKEREHWQDLKKQLERDLRSLDEPIRNAQRRITDLEKIANDALTKDEQYRGVLGQKYGSFIGNLPIVRAVVRMPLLDFAAPRDTPGKYQVNQLVLPAIRQQLNYLESYTTDRCTTCHVAIIDPEFSKERLAQKLERRLPGILEAMERLGRPALELPAPPIVDGKQLPRGKVTDFWSRLSRDQQGDYFDTLLALVNTYLEASGRKAIALKQPLLAHPDLDLYASVDSPHPMATVGCTSCHAGNPQETEFMLAAHSPPTHEIEERWKDDYYIKRLGVTQVTFETIAHYWDRPMRLPQHTEAGCAKCHAAVSDISRFNGRRVGAKINLGRQLFTSTGCINCHKVDDIPDARRVGPDLTYVADKLQPGFVQRWAFFPQKFRPSTLMPHFFLQENNDADSVNEFDKKPVLRTETEVAAISKYLFAVSRPWEPVAKPAEVSGDVDRGRQLFQSVGCVACHSNLAEYGEDWITQDLVHREGIDETTARHRYKGMTDEQRTRYAMAHFVNERETYLTPDRVRPDLDRDYNPPVFSRFAPELSGIGSKVQFDWLYSWLMEPAHYSPQTVMPRLRLEPAEAADITAYLLTLKNDAFDQAEFELDAERLAMVDELIFTLLSAQRSERRSRSIMADEGGELTAMLTALLQGSLGRDAAYDLTSALSLQDKKLVFLGNKMIAHYGCYACHNIPAFEGTTPPGTKLTLWAQKPISQLDFAFYYHAFHGMREHKEDIYGHLYPETADQLNHWSPGDNPKEQITQTHHAFAKHKLRNPRIWDREKIKRPYDKLKMPNFYFDDEEAEALTTYLMSRVSPLVHDSLKVGTEGTRANAIARGRDLTRLLNCVGCHDIEDNAPTVQQYFRLKQSGQQVFDSVNAPPSLWGEGAKLQHPWFHDYLKNVEPLRPWLRIRMPSFNLTGDEATTLVEYFAALAQQDATNLHDETVPISEYIAEAESKGDVAQDGGAPGSDWYEQDALRDNAANLRNWSLRRRLMRPGELDPVTTAPKRFKAAHAKLLDRAKFMSKLYDVSYPFVEPHRPLSSSERFELGGQFFNDMGCLKCHILGSMLPGPAKTTDDFVNVYRLDGVRGEGDTAVAILNGKHYPVGSVIDGHKLVSAENIFYDTGDVDTKAVVEGVNRAGEIERIVLAAPSAPNLSLTHRRLRRDWVFNWMLEPGWIMPGTKMPQNFLNGQSPFAGDEQYPGTGVDHINLLVDYLYDAGQTNARVPLAKVVLEDDDGDAEFLDDEEFDD